MSVNIIRKALATDAGVTEAVAQTLTGADLEFAKLQRKAGGGNVGSGADLLRAGEKASIIRSGESTYAAAGGKVTRIIGEGFTGATGAQANGVAFTAFSVIDDETIQGTTPAVAAGTRDLTVLHPLGNAVLTGGIVYV